MVHANSIHLPHSPISYWLAWYHMLWSLSMVSKANVPSILHITFLPLTVVLNPFGSENDTMTISMTGKGSILMDISETSLSPNLNLSSLINF